MTFLKRFMLTASVVVGALLMVSSASASQIFYFSGITQDGDVFHLDLTTTDNSDNHTTVPSPTDPYTAPNSNLVTPSYTFTGYLITGISGTWYDATDKNVYQIKDLMIPGSILDSSVDHIAHAPTDNLFDPKISAGPLALGKFSYGGIGFSISNGDQYQLFTNPATGEYAGCPGTCVTVTETIDAPDTLSLMGIGLMLVWSQGFRRSTVSAKSSRPE
jgi:hypothetical protein